MQSEQEPEYQVDYRTVNKDKPRRRVSRPTVVFVASEAVPFAKTGGLADVTGALIKELAGIGCRTILILPKYQSIPEDLIRLTDLSIEVPVGRSPVTARIWEGRKTGDTSVYLLDIPPFLVNEWSMGSSLVGYSDRKQSRCRPFDDPVSGHGSIFQSCLPVKQLEYDHNMKQRAMLLAGWDYSGRQLIWVGGSRHDAREPGRHSILRS